MQISYTENTNITEIYFKEKKINFNRRKYRLIYCLLTAGGKTFAGFHTAPVIIGAHRLPVTNLSGNFKSPRHGVNLWEVCKCDSRHVSHIPLLSSFICQMALYCITLNVPCHTLPYWTSCLPDAHVVFHLWNNVNLIGNLLGKHRTMQLGQVITQGFISTCVFVM